MKKFHLILLLSFCSFLIQSQDAQLQENISEQEVSLVDQEKEKQEDNLDEIENGESQESESFELDEQDQNNLEEVEQEPAEEKFILLDRIEAVVAESDQVKIITNLDVARRGFDGNQYSVDDLVNENLLDILADKLKINVDDKDVTRFLQKMNASEEQMKQVAQANGFANLSELYDQFKKNFRAQSALGFKTQSELVFSEDTIAQYHKDNPVITESKYVIQTSYINVDSPDKKDEIKQEIEKSIKHEPANIEITWDDPVSILEKEVSDENSFLFEMKEGEVRFKELSNGFSLFKMCKSFPARELTLEERKLEIVNTLRNQKYEEVVTRVFNQLRTNSLILRPSFEEFPVPKLVS